MVKNFKKYSIELQTNIYAAVHRFQGYVPVVSLVVVCINVDEHTVIYTTTGDTGTYP
jgi:hypothetical protein